MIEDVLYTPEEIANKLKLTKGTVYEMIKRGDINAHKIGRYLRISQTQFDNYLQKTSGYDNIFEAYIEKTDDSTFAKINDLKIAVETNLTDKVKISIKPENIILSKGNFLSSARNVHKGIVNDIKSDNNNILVTVDIGIPLKSLITKKSLDVLNLSIGDEVYTMFKAMSVYVYK
ncbi:helix-turn-helix domain-containing protein [Soehngenia saccharolytica]|nr:helix-turn-helix domain-containing protein [Soehngenia saccharolytica]